VYIPWRYDLRPTWRVLLIYRLGARPVLQGRAAQRLESELTGSGRVRAPNVMLTRGRATVRFVVKGVDDLEASYVALAYVDAARAQVQGLDLGELTYRSVTPHLPSTEGDGDY
jgi:hypothetical protein